VGPPSLSELASASGAVSGAMRVRLNRSYLTPFLRSPMDERTGEFTSTAHSAAHGPRRTRPVEAVPLDGFALLAVSLLVSVLVSFATVQPRSRRNSADREQRLVLV
jgi:hypothetical protein